MKLEKQQAIKQKNYAEAMRYIANAKDNLKLAGQEGRYYTDRKYVRTACGTAYNGVLIALDYFFELKNVELPKTGKSVDYYRQGLSDYQKARNAFNSAYDILYLNGYYDGILDSDVVKIGFARANEIISLIKPSGGGSMKPQEKQAIKQEHYANAMRYIANAKEVLQRAGFEDGRYKDDKYVRMACGTAYVGVLIALEGWLKLKGIDFSSISENKNKRKSIDFYKDNVSKLDRKLKSFLDDAYQFLHLDGYYDGILNANVVKEGFAAAKNIIAQIKPQAVAL